MASLMVTTMVSPMVAYRRLEPPSTLMHCKRRAPELSATSRLVSIWIIGPVLRCRLFLPASAPRLRSSDLAVLQHHPALVLGDRPALLDPDDIADLEGRLLVVRMELLGPAHGLLEQWVHVAPLHLDHYGLDVLVRHHHALQYALRHALILTLCWLRRCAFAPAPS